MLRSKNDAAAFREILEQLPVFAKKADISFGSEIKRVPLAPDFVLDVRGGKSIVYPAPRLPEEDDPDINQLRSNLDYRNTFPILVVGAIDLFQPGEPKATTKEKLGRFLEIILLQAVKENAIEKAPPPFL